jgi:hypothetical protein
MVLSIQELSRLPNQLYVEGKTDLHITLQLLMQFTHGSENNPPLHINEKSGKDNILSKPKFIQTVLDTETTRAVGFVLDADDDAEDRWKSIRSQLVAIDASVAVDLPATGLIHLLPDDKRVGVWIMPDNRSNGAIETLCAKLIPAEQSQVWDYTETAITTAKKRGATWRNPEDRDKARIHSYLAWQSEPGTPPGLAIKTRLLDAHAAAAKPYIDWALELFQLPRLPPSVETRKP